MEDQEEQRQWLEDIKNSYAVANKEWMDKDKTLRVESKYSFIKFSTKYILILYIFEICRC